MAHSHEREADVFEAALQLPPEQRETYLERTCAGDAELVNRVRALLKGEEDDAEFLSPPALAILRIRYRRPKQSATASAPISCCSRSRKEDAMWSIWLSRRNRSVAA
jgi:hypothetical protein